MPGLGGSVNTNLLRLPVEKRYDIVVHVAKVGELLSLGRMYSARRRRARRGERSGSH